MVGFVISSLAPKTVVFSNTSFSFLIPTENNPSKNLTKTHNPYSKIRPCFGHAPRNLYMGISMNDGEGFLLAIKLDRLESW